MTAIAIYPEDELLQELAGSEEEWSRGAASYGPGGTWDAMRKIVVSSTLIKILTTEEKKPTDKVLDALAHADGEYALWVQDHTVSRAQWLALDAKRTRIYQELRMMQARGFDRARNGA